MQKLLDVGFEDAATVSLTPAVRATIPAIKFTIKKFSKARNILYAIWFGLSDQTSIDEWEVRYIGHTRKTFANRMTGYQSPGKSQAVNHRVNKAISKHLQGGGIVGVHVLSDKFALSMHELHLDVAAGLEYAIIDFYCRHNQRMSHHPLLNIAGNTCSHGSGKSNSNTPVQQSDIVEEKAAENEDYGGEQDPNIGRKPAIYPNCDALPCRFSFQLTPKTYWPISVFNVPIECQKHFGAHGDIVTVDLMGKAPSTVQVSVNRTANQNKTPRLYFSAPAGDVYEQWKIQNHRQGDRVTVDVVGHNHIHLT